MDLIAAVVFVCLAWLGFVALAVAFAAWGSLTRPRQRRRS